MAESETPSSDKQNKGVATMETLQNCEQIVSLIYANKGDSFVQAEDIYAICGKPRGTMVLKVSACVHYGLLINQRGKGYQVTKLFVDIERPEYESDVRNKRLESFALPEINKKLIERYNSKQLPTPSGIANALLEYDVNPNSTAKAASVFMENCEFLGLIENGRLRYFIPTTTQPLKHKNEEPSSVEKQEQPKQPVQNTSSQENDLFTLPIDLGESLAYLQYPKKITLEQTATLRIWLEASLQALESRLKKKSEAQY